ncbi:MAG: hypothetical protein DWQ01_00400 [Planctomycetota bacterium]|nr:MAG: hypothetical protein DWQ01_00400 [Planctomycetota bacterium]
MLSSGTLVAVLSILSIGFQEPKAVLLADLEEPKTEAWFQQLGLHPERDFRLPAVTMEILPVDRHLYEISLYGIQTLPAVVIHQASGEVQLWQGSEAAKMSQDLFRAWLVAARAESLSAALHGSTDVNARYAFALDMLKRKNYAIAAEHFEWLWWHGLEAEPAFHMKRDLFLPHGMKRLRQAWPDGRRWAEAMARRGLWQMGDREQDFYDLIVLTKVLGDPWPLKEWGKQRNEQNHLPPMSQDLQWRFFETLFDLGEWKAAGRWLPSPRVAIRASEQETEQIQMTREVGDGRRHRAWLAQSRNLGRAYAALLLADRRKDAEQIRQAVLRTFSLRDGQALLLGHATRVGIQENDPRMGPARKKH